VHAGGDNRQHPCGAFLNKLTYISNILFSVRQEDVITCMMLHDACPVLENMDYLNTQINTIA